MDNQTFDTLQLIKYNELPYFRVYFKDVVVVYTMIGCHWCTKCMPDVKAAIGERESKQIPVLHVVFNNDKTVLEEENIQGFPSIVKYNKDSREYFKGERTKANFVKFFS